MQELSFNRILAECQQFEGMVSDFDLALFQALLDLQTKNSIAGNIIEFGVYKGKSATALLLNLRPNETLYLVEIAQEYVAGFLQKYKDRAIKFHHGKSEEFKKMNPDYSQLKRGFRFIHSDGSHFFCLY